MWDLIVSVPDHCLSFYSFSRSLSYKMSLVGNERGVSNKHCLLPFFFFFISSSNVL